MTGAAGQMNASREDPRVLSGYCQRSTPGHHNNLLGALAQSGCQVREEGPGASGWAAGR